MESQINDKHKKHLAQIVKVVKDILKAQTVILQRIENGYQEQLRVYLELSNKMDLLEKKIEGGFTVLETNRIASLDKNITEKLKNLDYDYLKELKMKLDSVHTKLLQQIQVQMFQLLIKESQKMPKKASVKKPSLEGLGPPTHSYRPYTIRTSSQSAPISQPQQASETLEEGWSESELEGAQIFDTIITGWKLRDWEEIKGTKEIFMRAWKKSSKSDRQKIKNGAWSKKIMKKLKLLGRSS